MSLFVFLFFMHEKTVLWLLWWWAGKQQWESPAILERQGTWGARTKTC